MIPHPKTVRYEPQDPATKRKIEQWTKADIQAAKVILQRDQNKVMVGLWQWAERTRQRAIEAGEWE